MDGMASNASDSLYDGSRCVAQYFVAHIFDGNLTQSGFSPYPRKSAQAHFAIGMGLLLVVFVWASFVVGYLRIRPAYLWSGGVQMLMGTYLLSWVFYWMHPEDPRALYEYSTQDLLQLQHIGISVCLISGGFLEIVVGGLKALRHPNWHSLWCFNLMLIGCLFLAHPQHNAFASAKHMILGLAICLGSHLFGCSKQNEFALTHGDMSMDWHVAGAGAFYTIAGVILCTFREEDREFHTGTYVQCQGGWPLTIISFVVAGLSAVLCLGWMFYDHWWAKRDFRGPIFWCQIQWEAWQDRGFRIDEPASADNNVDSRAKYEQVELQEARDHESLDLALRLDDAEAESGADFGSDSEREADTPTSRSLELSAARLHRIVNDR